MKNAVLLLLVITSALAETLPSRSSLRLTQLVDANITAVHAYQMLLARKQPSMDKACWPSTPPDVDLESLVAHQTSLLNSPAGPRRPPSSPS